MYEYVQYLKFVFKGHTSLVGSHLNANRLFHIPYDLTVQNH